MDHICYLIPSHLERKITEKLDRAGISFHVADEEDLAGYIAQFIIAFHGLEHNTERGEEI